MTENCHSRTPQIIRFGFLAVMVALACYATMRQMTPKPVTSETPPRGFFDSWTAVDLTHPLDENSPTWPGSRRFSKTRYIDYDQGYTKMAYEMDEGLGTHVDAPAHFLKGARSISDLGLEELVTPAVVVDVTAAVEANPDYALSVDDILAWEKRNGPIPAGALVIARTGWSARWGSESAYRNADKFRIMHFPGFSKEAAEFLVTERRISGIGIDTLSLDPGVSKTFDVHRILFEADKYQIENLANLAALPETGAVVLALPLKIVDGPEAAARVIGLAPVK
ncbi:cyclase family protein [bacterium]|nr:cyclase family protein [bacterium]